MSAPSPDRLKVLRRSKVLGTAMALRDIAWANENMGEWANWDALVCELSKRGGVDKSVVAEVRTRQRIVGIDRPESLRDAMFEAMED